MHTSAMSNGNLFFKRYMPYLPSNGVPKVVEIGAQNVNGSLRDACSDNVEYIGVDFVEGKGVNIVLDDPYSLPFEDESVDVVVSSSCLEHSEMFWLLYLEAIRVLKPHGLFYLNVPSNGAFHRYPVDCWRFFPDSGKALVTWGRRNHYNVALLESFTSYQQNDVWNDFVSIFIKDEVFAKFYVEKMFTGRNDVENVMTLGQNEIMRQTEKTQDLRNLSKLKNQITAIKKILTD